MRVFPKLSRLIFILFSNRIDESKVYPCLKYLNLVKDRNFKEKLFKLPHLDFTSSKMYRNKNPDF